MSEREPDAEAVREPVLSPVDRVSELLFGLFMALTFVGAVSVADSGREQIRSMFAAALGCNLAWGLVDAVMYLVRTVTDRGRSLTLVRSVRAAAWWRMGNDTGFRAGTRSNDYLGETRFLRRGRVRAENGEHANSYAYAWSELGFRMVDWLRIGIAGQRTRIYGDAREFQRGPFAQLTWGPVTVGGYWFNPGSNQQIFVGMLGTTF